MPESLDFNLLAGFLLSVLLIASALLGWLGDMKRVGAATSARETTRKTRGASRTRPASGAGAKTSSSTRSAAQEQDDRIRDAYFAKEHKAREFRERQRRQQARQRTRTTSGSASGGNNQRRAPSTSATTDEARHRLTLGLQGTVTAQSLRTSYRRLIAAYHPDRCATLGIKLRKLAEEETKRINEAYSYFQRQLK